MSTEGARRQNRRISQVKGQSQQIPWAEYFRLRLFAIPFFFGATERQLFRIFLQGEINHVSTIRSRTLSHRS